MGVEGEIVGEISIDDYYRRQKVFAVRVSRNSMEPETFDGEIAIFKPINGEGKKDRDIFAVDEEGWVSWVIKIRARRPEQHGPVDFRKPDLPVDPKVSRVILSGKLRESEY